MVWILWVQSLNFVIKEVYENRDVLDRDVSRVDCNDSITYLTNNAALFYIPLARKQAEETETTTHIQ